ncbi:MAG: hypothetical protein ABR573_07430 [Candidatus Dormibacteria bacterium]
MTIQRKRAILGLLLALEGVLIIAGAVVVAFSVSALYPLDQLLGADASVAAVVIGAAFIMTFRNPTRSWVNLAILYSALTIAVQLWKYTTSYGTRPSLLTMVISAIFLVGFLALYPRNEAVASTEAVPA